MLDLTQMRYFLRKGLGLATGSGAPGEDSEEDLSNDDADLLLNMALWDLESKFPFKEKECRTSMTTIVGQGLYELPSNVDAIISVSATNPDGTFHSRLDRMSFAYFDGLERPLSEGTPLRYARRSNMIVLWPTPNAEFTLTVTMWKSVASLLEGEVDTPNLPRNWHELVVEGAIVRGHFYSKDYTLAQQASNITLGKIRSAVPTDAKEEGASKYARMRPVLDDPEFEDGMDLSDYSWRKNLFGGRIP